MSKKKAKDDLVISLPTKSAIDEAFDVLAGKILLHKSREAEENTMRVQNENLIVDEYFGRKKKGSAKASSDMYNVEVIYTHKIVCDLAALSEAVGDMASSIIIKKPEFSVSGMNALVKALTADAVSGDIAAKEKLEKLTAAVKKHVSIEPYKPTVKVEIKTEK